MTAQDVVLIISALTNFFALGVPVFQGHFESNRNRQHARQNEIERLLFFLLENYREHARGIYLERFESMEALREKENFEKYLSEKKRYGVPDFQKNLVRLKTFVKHYNIDDFNFSNSIDRYLSAIHSPPSKSEDIEIIKKDIVKSILISQEQLEIGVEIENSAIQFLTSINERFSNPRRLGLSPD